MSWAAAINSGINALGSIFGALDQHQQINWNSAFLINLLNNTNWGRDFMVQRLQESLGPYADAAKGLYNKGDQMLWDTQVDPQTGQSIGMYPFMNDYAKQMLGDVRTAYWSGDRGLFMPDEASRAMNNIYGMTGPGSWNDIMANAGQEMYGKAQGGVDAMNNWGMGTLQAIAQGNAPGQEYLMDFATQLSQNQGNTGDTWAASKAFQDMMNAGGYTGKMNDIYGASNIMAQNEGISVPMANNLNRQINIMNKEGYTPNLGGIFDSARQIAQNEGFGVPMATTLNSLLGIIGKGGATEGTDTLGRFGTQGLQSGGRTAGLDYGQNYLQGLLQSQGGTAGSNFLQQQGAQLAGQNPLLGMEKAASLARDEAGTRNIQGRQAAQRQALARGNGPGVQTAYSNEALRNITDEGLRNEAAAVRQAIQGEEALGLQQRGMGFNALTSGLSQAANREQMGAQMLPQLEQLATGNQNLAGNLLGNAERIAADRYSSGGNLFNNLYGVANQRYFGGMDDALKAEAAAASNLGMANNQFNSIYGLGNARYFGAMDDAQAMEQMRLQNQTGLGGLAMQGGQLGMGRMGLAGNQMQNYLTNQLQGTSGASNWGNIGFNAMNSGLGQLSAAQNFGLGANQAAYGIYNTQMGQNLNRLNGQFGAMSPLFGQYNTMAGNMQQGQLAGLSGMQNIAMAPYQYLTQLLTGANGLAGGLMTAQNPFGGIGSALGGFTNSLGGKK